jgi:protein gp37
VKNGYEGKPVYKWKQTEETLHKLMGLREHRHIIVDVDLFDDSYSFEFIDRVFAVMALCPQHTFQILTKRPERMAEYLRSFHDDCEVGGSHGMGRLGNAAGCLLDGVWIWGEGARHRTRINEFISDAYEFDDDDVEYQSKPVPWPLPNVWLGTSAEDQQRLDERVPHLLRCPAAVRFLSLEPLLGKLDLSAYFGGEYVALPGDRVVPNYNFGIHQIIVGGESGPHARPCDVAWIRSIVKQCADAGVPCYVKQLGSNVLIRNDSFDEWPREGDELRYDEDDIGFRHQGDLVRVRLRDPKGGDPSEWPEDLRVREFPVVGAKGGA